MTEITLPLEEYRGYLALLARARLGRALRGRIDASDVVQQAMLIAHREASQFRGGGSAELAAWLGQILNRQLLNIARDHHRDCRDARRDVSLDWTVDRSDARLAACLAAVQSTPSQRAIGNEQLVLLGRALAALPAAQRQAVEMRYLDECSVKDIAESMQRTPAAVASLLHRGLENLQRLVQEQSA